MTETSTAEAAPGATGVSDSGVVTKVADFAQLTPDSGRSPVSSLDGLLDIRVEVTAELGRVSIPIGDILKMSVGSVLELDRLVSEPVDLFVQGRRLARGEVVVVDDRFAIRVKELAEPRKK